MGILDTRRCYNGWSSLKNINGKIKSRQVPGWPIFKETLCIQDPEMLAAPTHLAASSAELAAGGRDRSQTPTAHPPPTRPSRARCCRNVSAADSISRGNATDDAHSDFLLVFRNTPMKKKKRKKEKKHTHTNTYDADRSDVSSPSLRGS